MGNRTGKAAAAQSSGECILGTIHLTASPRLGLGVPVRGQLLSISQNSALFSLLGTTFGGDGVTTFALPDMRAAAPNDTTYTMCTQGIYPSYE